MKKQLTIEEVEKASGVKLTYPNQIIEGSVNEDRYKELRAFGCSDIWDSQGSWYHRDCFRGPKFTLNLETFEFIKTSEGGCAECNFYPIVQEYKKKESEKTDVPADATKAGFMINNLKKLKDGNESTSIF